MEVEVTGAEETKVWHDGNWLGEAVYNLLDNSVKYAPEHSKIRVVVRQDEMYTRIVVSDDGIGIPEGEENLMYSWMLNFQYMSEYYVKCTKNLKCTKMKPIFIFSLILSGKEQIR